MKKGSDVVLEQMFYSATEKLRQIIQVPAMRQYPKMAEINFYNAVGLIEVLQRIRHEDSNLWNAQFERAFYDLDELADKAQKWLKDRGL